LLGSQKFEKFRNSKILLVGSGALGCEYLKILSRSGISTGEGSSTTVVDDDQIELSNLNRQFLFRNEHIGQSKAVTSARVARTFNPEFRVLAEVGRLQPSTENFFTDEFWDGLDIVINAVDNIKARKYVDQKVVLHQKAFFESGTLGTKCNSQIILPGLTESYSDSQDPEEKSTPQCTIRSFPYLIDHCIEWAREKFSDIFEKPSQVFKEFKNDPQKQKGELLEQLNHDLNRLVGQREYFHMYLELLRNPVLEEYIKVGINLYQEYFEFKIQELLSLFPADYVDKEGKLFWTSPK
jgi:ubiquitin-activating enzyme E1